MGQHGWYEYTSHSTRSDGLSIEKITPAVTRYPTATSLWLHWGGTGHAFTMEEINALFRTLGAVPATMDPASRRKPILDALQIAMPPGGMTDVTTVLDQTIALRNRDLEAVRYTKADPEISKDIRGMESRLEAFKAHTQTTATGIAALHAALAQV